MLMVPGCMLMVPGGMACLCLLWPPKLPFSEEAQKSAQSERFARAQLEGLAGPWFGRQLRPATVCWVAVTKLALESSSGDHRSTKSEWREHCVVVALSCPSWAQEEVAHRSIQFCEKLLLSYRSFNFGWTNIAFVSSNRCSLQIVVHVSSMRCFVTFLF